MPYYYFLSILFTNRPTAEIFKTFLKTCDILSASAGGGEVISEYFSYYFTNNLPASLDILKKINDEEIISDIFSELDEKGCYKIRDYIEKNKLQKKPYYKFVKDYLH